MSESSINIREIKPEDNAQMEAIIRGCFHEFGLPLVGTAYEDNETPRMYESYQKPNEIYFVIEDAGEVVGGAGIKPLKDFEGDVCELQKMYYSPKVRGKGLGKIMFQKCLDAAKDLGYKQCYLESASQLKAAIHIYEQFGFDHLDGPMGNTGHYSCGVWMIKDL
ncbi:GNAT family N-acetyltransferase [Winogradskyella sp. 3972H.M.0a.05]|uniref:GNAT family N-acetyltransferase n=1 Tax=Winogradskyella sp. 3972H.M.0a.05 TaxID=2950277 RepID=UPI003398ED6F